MLHGFVLHNDEIVAASEPILSAGQVGSLMGWGVFSTLRVSKGCLFAFERHWARMKRDAQLVRVPFPSDPEWLQERLLWLVKANDCLEATLRVCIVRNTGTVFTGPAIKREFDLVAMTTGLANWGSSIRLSVAANGRFAASPYSRTKVLSWAFNLNWYTEAHECGFDEVILQNELGDVAECTSANIFAVFRNEVFTPPLESGCLPGITRELLLNQISVPGITISERRLRLEDLAVADSVFVSSTTRDVLPVAEIEGISVNRDDSVSVKLNAALRAYIEDYVSAKAIA
ncbi:MAG TPA: aminotransferase class IV [Bryobacteraceae bacterium]|nr:aminotransferase class IV [Bryobacteraceae bacterium]